MRVHSTFFSESRCLAAAAGCGIPLGLACNVGAVVEVDGTGQHDKDLLGRCALHTEYLWACVVHDLGTQEA